MKRPKNQSVDAQKFWAFVESAAREVAAWPEWMLYGHRRTSMEPPRTAEEIYDTLNRTDYLTHVEATGVVGFGHIMMQRATAETWVVWDVNEEGGYGSASTHHVAELAFALKTADEWHFSQVTPVLSERIG